MYKTNTGAPGRRFQSSILMLAVYVRFCFDRHTAASLTCNVMAKRSDLCCEQSPFQDETLATDIAADVTSTDYQF